EGFDQLAQHAIVPELAYKLVLVLYVGGLPASLVVGWFHGEKGEQRVTSGELGLLSLVAASTVFVGVIVARPQLSGGAAGVAAGILDQSSIAVLYFKDLSPQQEVQHLADGFSEALIAQLSQVRSLDVVSPNGVRAFRDSGLDPDSIARILGAGTLVEGSIEPVRDRIRVQVRLLDGASGAEFRRGTFERASGELLDIRDDLAEEVSRFLRAWLGEEMYLRQTRTGSESVAGWALVQRANRLRKVSDDRLGADDLPGALAALEQADTLLARAEEVDTAWAEPSIRRAEVAYRHSRLTRALPELSASVEKGLVHVQRGLSLEPSNAEALELRGTLRYWAWIRGLTHDPAERNRMLQAARQDLEGAVRTDPTRAGAYSTLSHLYYQEGVRDVPAAVLAARRAYEEDAYLEVADEVLWRLFGGSLDLEQFDQARRWCGEGVQRFAADYRFVVCQLRLMMTPAVAPDVESAWALKTRVESLAPEPRRAYESVQGEIMVGAVLARAGLADSARAVLERARTRRDYGTDPSRELTVYEAYARILLNEEDEAIDLLKEYAAAQHGFDPAGDVGWWWRELRDHPRFHELSTRR
ncbi:MAG: hypothetical protein HY701_05395, partial [Gemmatimonadetes bacterium]|nr:hypothetical protein [Gemmatimonadota bacterium]